MKTIDERSVLTPVLAVPVPVLVLDEEEAIEDLAVTICAFQQGLGEEFALYSPDPTDGGVPAAREKLQSVLATTFCTYFGQSPAERFADLFGQATYLAYTWPKTTCSRTATRGRRSSPRSPSCEAPASAWRSTIRTTP